MNGYERYILPVEVPTGAADRTEYKAILHLPRSATETRDSLLTDYLIRGAMQAMGICCYRRIED